MTYVFKQDFVPSAKHSIKCPYKMTPQFITVHNTANDAPAENEIAYMKRNNNAVSYHVAVDDKNVIQAIPFNRNAWHCGDGGNGTGNRKSIGIEICYSKSGGERYRQAEENAVQYIAKLLHEFGWGVDRVKQHYDWSRKNCPHRIRDEKRWDSFVQRINDALQALKNPKAKAKEEAEVIVLNETGRKEAREIIKRAVKEGVFTSKHENVDKYDDGTLVSYVIAYVNRVGIRGQSKTK